MFKKTFFRTPLVAASANPPLDVLSSLQSSEKPFRQNWVEKSFLLRFKRPWQYHILFNYIATKFELSCYWKKISVWPTMILKKFFAFRLRKLFVEFWFSSRQTHKSNDSCMSGLFWGSKRRCVNRLSSIPQLTLTLLLKELKLELRIKN